MISLFFLSLCITSKLTIKSNWFKQSCHISNFHCGFWRKIKTKSHNEVLRVLCYVSIKAADFSFSLLLPRSLLVDAAPLQKNVLETIFFPTNCCKVVEPCCPPFWRLLHLLTTSRSFWRPIHFGRKHGLFLFLKCSFYLRFIYYFLEQIVKGFVTQGKGALSNSKPWDRLWSLRRGPQKDIIINLDHLLTSRMLIPMEYLTPLSGKTNRMARMYRNHSIRFPKLK